MVVQLILANQPIEGSNPSLSFPPVSRETGWSPPHLFYSLVS